MTKVILERLDRAERALRAFESLVDYWSDSIRKQGYKSDRLDQSAEFIAERVLMCTNWLSYWRNQVAMLKAKVNEN
jgi:hypothetical protein